MSFSGWVGRPTWIECTERDETNNGQYPITFSSTMPIRSSIQAEGWMREFNVKSIGEVSYMTTTMMRWRQHTSTICRRKAGNEEILKRAFQRFQWGWLTSSIHLLRIRDIIKAEKLIFTFSLKVEKCVWAFRQFMLFQEAQKCLSLNFSITFSKRKKTGQQTESVEKGANKQGKITLYLNYWVPSRVSRFFVVLPLTLTWQQRRLH